MTPEASLLTPDVLAIVGTGPDPVPVVVTPGAVRRSLEVLLGDGHGLRFEPGDDVPACALIAIQPEGNERPMPDLMRDKLELGNEFDMVRPLRLGETVLVRSRIGPITERFGGRFGYSLTIRMDTEILDQAGALIARVSTLAMQYDARNARDDGAGDPG